MVLVIQNKELTRVGFAKQGESHMLFENMEGTCKLKRTGMYECLSGDVMDSREGAQSGEQKGP